MRPLFFLVFLAILSPEVHASQPDKERLVLKPLHVSEAGESLKGAMEIALVEGLQQKYQVFYGELVAQKAPEIFRKELIAQYHPEAMR